MIPYVSVQSLGRQTVSIKTEDQIHGAAILTLFEALGQALPSIKFSLQTGHSRNCYIVEGIQPSVLGKGKTVASGLYVKMSNKRRSPWRYTFLREHQDEIRELHQKYGETFTVFANGLDGFACLSFSELKEILDDVHEEQEWVAVSRKPRQAYRVSGNDGRRETALTQNAFPKSIVAYFEKAYA